MSPRLMYAFDVRGPEAMAKGKKTLAERARSGIGPLTATANENVTDIRLLALDGEINRLVLEVELLEARRRRAEETRERQRIGRQIRTQQKKIAKLYSTMSRAEPVSLVGAAALLRRVPAMLNDNSDGDGPLSIASRLVDSALVVVEKSAE